MKGVVLSAVSIYNGFHMARIHKGEQGRADGGDQEALFLKAFDDYADALFRHAVMRLSNRERAIELVHDTYTKVWGYLREGHEVASFRPFLYKVLGNLIIDEYRKNKEVSLDAILAEDGVDEGAFDELRHEPLEGLIDSLDAKRALAGLDEIPEIYREILILRFVDGLAPKDIAVLTEETENVVSVRLHRGVRLLRAKVEEWEERHKRPTS